MNHRKLCIALLAAGFFGAGASAGTAGKTVKLNHGGTSLAAANGTFGATATWDAVSAKLAFTADIDPVALRQRLNAAVHIGASVSSGYKKKPVVSAGALVSNTRVYSKTSSKSFRFEFRSSTALLSVGRSHMVGPIQVDLRAVAHCTGSAWVDLRADTYSVAAGVPYMNGFVYLEYTCSAGAGFGPERRASAAGLVMDAQVDTLDGSGRVGYQGAYWDLRSGSCYGDGVYLGLYEGSSADIEVYADRGNETYHDSIAKWTAPSRRLTLMSRR